MNLKLIGTVHLNEADWSDNDDVQGHPARPRHPGRSAERIRIELQWRSTSSAGDTAVLWCIHRDCRLHALEHAIDRGCAVGKQLPDHRGPRRQWSRQLHRAVAVQSHDDCRCHYRSGRWLYGFHDVAIAWGRAAAHRKIAVQNAGGAIGHDRQGPPMSRTTSGIGNMLQRIADRTHGREVGPGPYPFVLPEPGAPPAPIYLTGPYDGAPFGLSIAVPIVAGPFNLGTEVVRAKIEVDPHTSQLTISTTAFPKTVKGIPTDIREIDAVIDRPEFMFNPTDCNSMSFSGTAYSFEGATAPVSSHFQMGSCRSLLFSPNCKVSTRGKMSRAERCELDARIVYPDREPRCQPGFLAVEHQKREGGLAQAAAVQVDDVAEGVSRKDV